MQKNSWRPHIQMLHSEIKPTKTFKDELQRESLISTKIPEVYFVSSHYVPKENVGMSITGYYATKVIICQLTT